MKKILLLLLLLLLFIPLSSSALTDGLVACYKMDDASGNLIDSHSSLDFLAVGTCYYGEPGKINTAVNCNSTGEPSNNRFHVDMATLSEDTVTISFFFKKNGGAADDMVFFGNSNSAFSQAGMRVMDLDGSLFMSVNDAGYGPNIQYDWTEDTSYHHFLATYNNTQMQLRFDGVNRANGTWDGRSLKERGDEVQLFSEPATVVGWTGNYTLDIVAIYNRSLSEAEKNELYNSGSPPDCPFVVDSCSCPGAGNNWEIDMSDFCNITSDCDLTTGTLSFTGAGWCNCNASVNTTNLGDPGTSGVLYIQDSCAITIN